VNLLKYVVFLFAFVVVHYQAMGVILFADFVHMHGQVHTKKRNRLEHQRLNKNGVFELQL
jgi:hypothetical protein